MSGIFISYRRDDTAGHAGRLFDHLSSTFGADGVFMDVDDIRRGEAFADTLTERLKQSDVLLAVIGRQWLTLTDSGGIRRLDKADDWVRSEVSAALGGGLLVIPVLVGGAALPKAADLPTDIRALAERQMADVRDGSWNDDIARLCKDIKRRRARGSWSEKLREHRTSAAITLSLALVAGGYSAYTWARNSRAAVPLVSGLTLDRATQAITAVGLNVGEVSKRATNDYPPESVLAQNPATATSVRKGTAIALTVAAPKAVDLTRYVMVKDVGREGTVAAAACAMAMEASLAAQGRPMRISMRYIYEKAKRHDEVAGEGTFLETTIYVARQFGAPPETRWPYTSLNRKMPAGVTWADLDSAASEYRANVTQVLTLDGVLGALDKGMAVIVSASATESWASELSTKTGFVKPAGAGEPLLGATVITIVGYDPATRRYKFANNWGPGWGDNGFGCFDSTDANAILLLQAGLWSVAVPPAER
jgi:hypothetical protein